MKVAETLTGFLKAIIITNPSLPWSNPGMLWRDRRRAIRAGSPGAHDARLHLIRSARVFRRRGRSALLGRYLREAAWRNGRTFF